MLESFPVSEKPLLVLASSSPRRRQLLALADWMFSIVVTDVDESQLPNEAPADYVLRLAETKARAADSQAHADQVVLGADTAVVDVAEILGKPKDMAEAARMLTQLRGHTHQVYTGVALLRLSDGLLLKELCVTDVPMRSYSDEEINAYVQTGDALDKAGAYAIQHPHFHPVAMPSDQGEGMSGCYASVMGLPMCHVVRSMRKMDIPPRGNVPVNCQTLLQYKCPVWRPILRGAI